jgi:hypothetical protein
MASVSTHHKVHSGYIHLHPLPLLHIQHEYNVETKWLPLLHLGLLFFNDPLFGVTFVIHKWYVTFIAEVLQAAFWAIILLFWLTALDSMVAETKSRAFQVYHFPKLVFALIFWGLFSFSHGWVVWHHMSSPYYSEDEELETEGVRDDQGVGIYGLVEYSLLLVMCAYCVWMGILTIRAIGTWRAMEHRLKLLCLFTLGMIFATLSSFFGFWLLHQNETGEGTAPLKFVTFTTMFNLYVGLLTVLCTPSEGSTKLK